MPSRFTYLIILAFVFFSLPGRAADDEKADESSKAAETTPASTAAKPSPTPAGSSQPKPAPPGHVALLKEAKPVAGLIPLWKKGGKLYAELNGSHYASEYVVLISLARGIGEGMLLGGMTWNFGDDWVWQFRKVDDKVHVIRRNVRFKAAKGSPEASAVLNSYTDSVLFSLPVITKGPGGGDMVDLTPVFMSDLPQISFVLPGFAFSSSKSSWASVKGFQDNVELQVAATYSSSGRVNMETVADSRGVTLNIHYSVSKIPSTGYKPRLADDRVGYFLTVLKDFSKKDSDDQFVRYINRWDLQKAEAAAKTSPPKQPIIFWIEKTVPFKYRKPIREGILEWNKAFEKAGFVDAIEVRQQPDDADWDPEDINYNTFRWITANAGMAMGPSRVNPYTGQLLDADILFDADFLTFWKEQFETWTPGEAEGEDTDKDAAMIGEQHAASPLQLFERRPAFSDCLLSRGMSHQLAFGASAIRAFAEPDKAVELQEKMILQGLKEVAMHEVGHTLGLRHNFKASTYRSLAEINDAKGGADGVTSASVMDYVPANIVPQGEHQGEYYPTTIGPYDYWAIEYGYRQFASNEATELKKIAARSGERALQFATDEDAGGFAPDPDVNTFDLGDDPIAFANQQAKLAEQLIPELIDRSVKDGEEFAKARQAFNVILSKYGQAMHYVSRYVGGLHTSRSHKGDKDASPPIAVIEPEKQRESLALLEQRVFNDKPFQFPPELYTHLAASNWDHWGMGAGVSEDYPIHRMILIWQEQILAQLMSSTTLSRIYDTELRVPAEEDAFTAAELLDRLTETVFAELTSIKGGGFTPRKPAISSIRRNLQRSLLVNLSNLAMGKTAAPDDCQAVACAELSELKAKISKILGGKAKLDAYTRAHLIACRERIDRVLEASLVLSRP